MKKFHEKKINTYRAVGTKLSI